MSSAQLVPGWRSSKLGKLRVQEPLQVRIGLSTSLVAVGDLVGSGEAQERGVVVRRLTSLHACRASPRRIRS
jgi:hypothetical protein